MEFNDFLKLIGKRKQTIFTFVFIGVMLALAISLIRPLNYGTRSRLLVMQNSATNDAYSLSRSNEYLGNLFAQVVPSGSFYDFVRVSQYNIDKDYFNGSYSQQLKKWQETVSVRTNSDTGIIEINVYHPNAEQSRLIALAINDVLINKNENYQSSGQIKINIIDQPLTSNYPVKPNLIYNGLIALAAAFMLALFYVYLFPEEKYNLALVGGHKKTRRQAGQISLSHEYRQDNQAYKHETHNHANSHSHNQHQHPSGDIRNILKD